MASPPGVLLRVGRWLAPEATLEQQGRIGVVGSLYGASLLGVIIAIPILMGLGVAGSVPTPAMVIGGILLVAVSVYLPQARFRTGAASSTRRTLQAPNRSIEAWSRSTLVFDAVLIGAMLGGLYMEPIFSTFIFALALLSRLAVSWRRGIARDANARYHLLAAVWRSGLIAAVAYSIVRPLGLAVTETSAIAPLLLAAIVGMYAGLVANALDRWARRERSGWAAARDAVDVRRLLVAGVSAGIAWIVAVGGEGLLTAWGPANGQAPGIAAGLVLYLLCWLILWVSSVLVWRGEAMRAMDLWQNRQSLIMARLADGSLSPELAAKAAINSVARITALVFGATEVLATFERHGVVERSQVHVDIDDLAGAPTASAPVELTGIRLPLSVDSAGFTTSTASSIVVGDCLLPGRLLLKSSGVVNRLSELASMTLMAPELARVNDSDAQAFDAMFIDGWPNLRAFDEATGRMRARFDAAPNRSSLVIGVYAVNEFPALQGGRHEHAVVMHLMRSAITAPCMAGVESFVAYEEPGRIWVAVAGGPIIRNTIQVLRDLQESLNATGRATSSADDVEIFVSVSFGYAAHQVDDLTTEGLAQTALDRLASDQAARDPFLAPDFLTVDLTPELFIEAELTPVTADNLIDDMAKDRGTDAFLVERADLIRTGDGDRFGHFLALSWEREFRYFDLRVPENLMKAVNRQMQLAVLYAQVSMDFVVPELDEPGICMVQMPSVLLHPEAGARSLPNVVVPLLDRVQSQRTVLLFADAPVGSGQALRMLHDRGLNIALTAAAAAAAESQDLQGWNRWGIVFPEAVLHGPDGIDTLTIQQTMTASAGTETQLIGMSRGAVDAKAAKASSLSALIVRADRRADRPMN